MNQYKVEAFDLWHYFSRNLFEPCIRVRIDLAGRLDAAALREAFTASCDMVPLITCGFDVSGHRPRWKPHPKAADEILRVVETYDAQSVSKQALIRSVDLARGPQLHATLVRHGNRDILCMVMNHMVCDAAGFKDYIHEVSRLYSAIVKGKKTVPSPCHSRSTAPVLAEFPLLGKLRIFFTRYDAYNKKVIEAGGAEKFEHEGGSAHLETVQLSASDFTAAKRAAKSHGATVNDLVMASFARAWMRKTGCDSLLLPCTMDLRAFVPSDVNIGVTNLSSNCLCSIKAPDKATIEDTMALVHRQMEVHKRGVSVIKSILLWEAVANATPFRLLGRCFEKIVSFPSISYSNLGILNDQYVRFDSIPVEAAYISAAIKPSPFFQLTVSTFRDSLTLSSNIEGAEEAAMFAREVLTMTADEIKRLKP